MFCQLLNQLTGNDKCFFVGQRNRFPCPHGRNRRRQSSDPNDRRDDGVDRRFGNNRFEMFFADQHIGVGERSEIEFFSGLWASRDDDFGLKLASVTDQLFQL